MILVDPPEAPFEIIYDADTSDTLLNITPPAGSQRMYLNAPGDKLEGWNKKKQTGSHTVWSTRNSDYDTGVVGTVRILNDPTDQVYLTNVDGSKKGLHLLPDGISVDTTAHSITEEFILRNDSEGADVLVIDACDSLTDWSVSYGSGSLSIDSGTVKFTGSTLSTGDIWVKKKPVTDIDLSTYTFITFDVYSDVAGLLIFNLVMPSGSFLRWSDSSRFNVPANLWIRFVLPIKSPVGITGATPVYTSGTMDPTHIKYFEIGIDVGSTITSINFKIDNITACNGTWAKVEVAVPDKLVSYGKSARIYCYNPAISGYLYNLMTDDNFETGVGDTSGNNSSTYFLDGTKLADIVGAPAPKFGDTGLSMYKKGTRGSISSDMTYAATGSITYSQNYGSAYRIGFAILMPPSDNGRTDFNKCRLKLVTYYDDENGNVVPDLSGCGNHGTIVGGVTKLNEGGLKLDGSGQVHIGRVNALRVSQSFTITAIIKPTLIAGDLRTIYSSGYSNADKKGIWLHINPEDNKIHCAIGNGTIREDKAFNSIINLDAIYRIVYTYDGATAKLYINGNLDGTSTGVTGDIIYHTNSYDKIGVRDEVTTVARYFYGDILSESFYNRVFSPEEATAYSNGQSVSTTGLVLHYKPTVSNMGSTTLEFTPQSLDHFTGLDNVGNWIAFERPDKRAEVFLFSRKLPSLSVTEDENGYITNIEVGVKKGTKVARSWVRYPDFDADGNSDDVPNFIDKIVEQLQNKFAFTRKYTNEVDLSGMAVVANDFSITLGDCDPVYAVSTGSRVYDSDGNLIPASETVVTANGSMDLIPVDGESTINIVGDELLNYGECKVFDTVTTGNATESTWLRVYDVDHVFTGDTVIENGLIRLKISTSAIYIFRYSGGNYVRLYGTGDCALRPLVWNGTASEVPVYRNYSFITISPEKIILEEQNGAASASENTLRYTILRGLFCLKSETLVNSTLRYITTNTTASNRAFHIVDGMLYDSGFGTGYISIPTTTGIGMRFEPNVNSIVAVMLHDNSIHVFKPTAIGSTFSSGVLQKTSVIVVPYSQQMYWEAEACPSYGSSTVADVDAYDGYAKEIRRPEEYKNYLEVVLKDICTAGIEYTALVRVKCTKAGQLTLYTFAIGFGITATSTPTVTIGSYAYYSLKFTPAAEYIGLGSFKLYIKNTCEIGEDAPINIDYILIVPTELIEKHAKCALVNLNEVKTYKEV